MLPHKHMLHHNNLNSQHTSPELIIHPHCFHYWLRGLPSKYPNLGVKLDQIWSYMLVQVQNKFLLKLRVNLLIVDSRTILLLILEFPQVILCTYRDHLLIPGLTITQLSVLLKMVKFNRQFPILITILKSQP